MARRAYGAAAFQKLEGLGPLPTQACTAPVSGVVGAWARGGCLAHGGLLSVSSALSAGSTPFPYNPLVMRLQAGVMASPPPPGLPAGGGPLAGPHHAWDEEPKPLLCSQYETLSDSE